MKLPLLSSFITLCFFCIHFLSVSGQEPEGYSSQKLAEGQTRWMTRQLGLNDSVKNIVYQINLKCINQVDSVRASNTGMIDKRDVYSSIYSDKKTALQAVLTPEQYSKYLLVFENPKNTP